MCFENSGAPLLERHLTSMVIVYNKSKVIIVNSFHGEVRCNNMEKRITEFFSELSFETDDSGHIYQNSGIHTFHFASSNLYLASQISWHSHFFASGKKS